MHCTHRKCPHCGHTVVTGFSTYYITNQMAHKTAFFAALSRRAYSSLVKVSERAQYQLRRGGGELGLSHRNKAKQRETMIPAGTAPRYKYTHTMYIYIQHIAVDRERLPLLRSRVMAGLPQGQLWLCLHGYIDWRWLRALRA